MSRYRARACDRGLFMRDVRQNADDKTSKKKNRKEEEEEKKDKLSASAKKTPPPFFFGKALLSFVICFVFHHKET